MARTRNLKPGFFLDDELAELSPLTRILFQGLWAQADREGRLDDRPKRIKAQALPYDEIDVNDALDNLHKAGFIIRYSAKEAKYIQIVKFSKHQHPHVNEAQSNIPAPEEYGTSTVQAPEEHGSNTPLNLKPSTLNLKPKEHVQNEFARWWAEYPKKVSKKKAAAIWKRIKPNADVLIADVLNRIANDDQWKGGYIPHPTTYLNGERWNDEIQKRNGIREKTIPEQYAEDREREDRYFSEVDGCALAEDVQAIPPPME